MGDFKGHYVNPSIWNIWELLKSPTGIVSRCSLKTYYNKRGNRDSNHQEPGNSLKTSWNPLQGDMGKIKEVLTNKYQSTGRPVTNYTAQIFTTQRLQLEGTTESPQLISKNYHGLSPYDEWRSFTWGNKDITSKNRSPRSILKSKHSWDYYSPTGSNFPSETLKRQQAATLFYRREYNRRP